MSNITKTLSLKNGDEVTVAQLSNEAMRSACENLQKRGIVVRSGDQKFVESLEFQRELARVLVVHWEVKEGDSLRPLNGKEQAALLDKHPSLANAIVTQAGALQKEYDEPYELDAGN